MDFQAHLESHHAKSSAKYIKNIIYGGIDGIITTFSIIAACFGANLGIKYIISMGVANLIADGFSMGFGDYISSFFEAKYILSEANKESIEFITNNEFEVKEMVELYKQEGLELEDSQKIVDVLISKDKYKPFFIKSMVSMELGLEIPDDNYKVQIKKEAMVTFGSFVVFGFIPLIIYIISNWSNYYNQNTIFIIDCFITLLTIIGLGYTQAHITKQSKLMGCVILTINGIISTSIAFAIGYGLEKAIH
jgi:VIT1/CCC1 family predicted Fe2+/Mn2+ transporter